MESPAQLNCGCKTHFLRRRAVARIGPPALVRARVEASDDGAGELRGAARGTMATETVTK